MRKKRILIVDDEPDFCRFTALGLRKWGYDVLTALEGQKALDLIRENKPDLVFMDIGLKGQIDGIKVARQIGSCWQIPVVYLTGHTDDQTLNLAKATGPFGYVLKPIEYTELKITIEVALYKAETEYRLKALSTELEQSNRRLQASKASFHNIVEKNADGIIVVDRSGIVRFVNPAAEFLFGRRAKEFLGELFGFPIVAGETLEIDTVRVNGENGIAEMCAAEIEWESEPAYLISIRDITERKKAEQALETLNKELDENIQQLNQSNRELSDFAHIASHDLKEPLRAIATLANWISTDYADKLGEDGREKMNLLLSRVARMHDLIGSILQYSKVGSIREEQSPVNLNECVREVIDILAPPANIVITVEKPLPVVECKKTSIMQVFHNLLSNAVKFMDKPQGQIRIGCVEENSFWKFSIADNGLGIEERHFEKIFQIFKTLQPLDKYENTGIGLAIAKKIVELCGGQIWVESEPGKGSTFFFTLPKQELGLVSAKLEANIAP